MFALSSVYVFVLSVKFPVPTIFTVMPDGAETPSGSKMKPSVPATCPTVQRVCLNRYCHSSEVSVRHCLAMFPPLLMALLPHSEKLPLNSVLSVDMLAPHCATELASLLQPKRSIVSASAPSLMLALPMALYCCSANDHVLLLRAYCRLPF